MPTPPISRSRTPSPLPPAPPRAPTPGAPAQVSRTEERRGESRRAEEESGRRKGVIPPVALIDYPSRPSRSSNPRDRDTRPRRSASTGGPPPRESSRRAYGPAPMDLRSERRASGQRPGERGKVGIVQGVKNMLGGGGGRSGARAEEDEWERERRRRGGVGRGYESAGDRGYDVRRGGMRAQGPPMLPSAMRRPQHRQEGYYSDEDYDRDRRRERDGRRRPRFEDDPPGRQGGRGGGGYESEEEEMYRRDGRGPRGYEMDWGGRGGGRDRMHRLPPPDPFSTSAMYDALPRSSSSSRPPPPHPADGPFRPGHLSYSARPLHRSRNGGGDGYIDSSEEEGDPYGRHPRGAGGYDPRYEDSYRGGGGGRMGGYPPDEYGPMIPRGGGGGMGMPGFVPQGPPRDPYAYGGRGGGGGYEDPYDEPYGRRGGGMGGGYADDGYGGYGSGMGTGMGMRGGSGGGGRGRYAGGW